MKKVCVVADDITGGDDIGLMYVKSGHPTLLYPYSGWEQAAFGGCDKLVVDTDSRFVPPEEAYRRVYDVVSRFAARGTEQFFNKQCSVFRGNIGAEFDAMLDALGLSFAPVVLGFPDNGRTTLHAVHYVWGVPLERSSFRNDPVNPMTRSNLAEILQAQTRRRVSTVPWESYLQGEGHLRQLLEQRREEGGYAIFDVRDNGDLALLARLLKDEPVICGSSAIAYYLGREEGPCSADGWPKPSPDSRVLCVAGSLTPQTLGQLRWAREAGYPEWVLDTRRLFQPGLEETGLVTECGALLRDHDVLTLRTSSDPAVVRQTKQAALARGFTGAEAAGRVSQALAEAARELAQAYSIRKFVVYGGDTSASFCRAFGIHGMRIGAEIESGIPVCASVEDPQFQFVLKSGSFGSPQFLKRALEKLRTEK